ncbi:hypothetical protein TWF730_010377 [Orbilia blumenaviensis]|uniref:Uncharacterized protein n=1 Tax=Orbilia blumenaviensis TaxID=1796055 RepID=A0AAV9UPB3_9PEZI
MKGTLRNRISRFFDGLKGGPGVQQRPGKPKPIKALPPHFDPTFPLETLPFDIKYALLETVGGVDYDAFVALIIASRAYHEVFTQHKRALNRVALWYDALRYKEESFLLAAVYDGLLDIDQPCSVEQSERIEDGYNDALDLGSSSALEPWYYAVVREGGEEMESKILENHVMVRRFANIFIRRAMFPRLMRRIQEWEESQTTTAKSKKKQEPSRKLGINRSVEQLCPNEPPATSTERRRIIKTIYHLSAFILIFYSRVRAHRPIDYIRGTIKFILSWGYWETKAVEMFVAWLAMEFNPLFYKLYRQARWWWAWNEHSPNSNDDYYSNTTEPEAWEEHYTCSLFALLVHEFPFHAAEWLSSSNSNWNYWHPPAARFEAMADWTSNLNIRIDIGASNWMISRLLYYANKPDTPASELKTRRIGMKGREWFVTTDGFLSACKFEPGREYLWGRLNSQELDSWMLLWDDWRLERWGYVFPRIGGSAAGLRS